MECSREYRKRMWKIYIFLKYFKWILSGILEVRILTGWKSESLEHLLTKTQSWPRFPRHPCPVSLPSPSSPWKVEAHSFHASPLSDDWAHGNPSPAPLTSLQLSWPRSLPTCQLWKTILVRSFLSLFTALDTADYSLFLATLLNVSDMVALCFGSYLSLSICGLTVGSSCQPWNCREIFLWFFSWSSAVLTLQAFPKQCKWLLGINIYIYSSNPCLQHPHTHTSSCLCIYTVECSEQSEVQQIEHWGGHPAPSLFCFPNPTVVSTYFTSAKDMIFCPLTGAINQGAKFQFTVFPHSTSNVSKFCWLCLLNSSPVGPFIS